LTIEIRRARTHEADALSALALRSKAHWGYDDEFLRLADRELVVSASMITAGHVFVAEKAGTMVGFYSLIEEDGHPELGHFFIAPPHIGSGIGRALWLHLVATATEVGYAYFRIVSDPNAEGFYLRMGATRIDAVPSPVQRDRLLPLLQVSLPPNRR
jgi:GNAT superfamily N-acetyltransferase